MAFISITQVKPGDKISQDVMTHKKNLLMMKGTVVSERELEILRAFLIAKVHIGTDNGSIDQAESAEQEKLDQQETQSSDWVMALHEAYDHMYVLLKKVFTLTSGTIQIPVLDIRSSLKAL